MEVVDSGEGIPKRELPRIFERFYRVDTARARATGGTGLGLAIVRHVVERHGGSVQVESELGQGSTFRLRIPQADVGRRSGLRRELRFDVEVSSLEAHVEPALAPHLPDLDLRPQASDLRPPATTALDSSTRPETSDQAAGSLFVVVSSLLARIRRPSDLRKLDDAELVELCQEIRQFLVEQISRSGGHLSPNLGVVELTIALHRSFDSPHDRIIWDVGHQAYVHKLVTGRMEGFSSLRKYGGMSGYPSRAESPHDFVENSHASTSLSYALGHALTHPDYWTVAVIGDGALTGGMAYEALNHIAVARPTNLVIVVNDNGRSYAPTVGGLAALANLVPLPPRPSLRMDQAHLRSDAARSAGGR